MQWRELSRGEHGRTVALVFARGDEVMATLSAWCREQDIGAAHFNAIGAFSDATLGWFDWGRSRTARSRWMNRSRC